MIANPSPHAQVKPHIGLIDGVNTHQNNYRQRQQNACRHKRWSSACDIRNSVHLFSTTVCAPIRRYLLNDTLLFRPGQYSSDFGKKGSMI